MHQVAGSASGEGSLRAWAGGVAVSIAALLALAGCTTGGGAADPSAGSASSGGASTGQSGGGAATSPAPSSSSSSAPALPAVITTTPVPAETPMSPATPVTLSIAHGKLTAVTMTNPAGKKVTGSLAADGSSWRSTEDLGYSKTYKIVASGVDDSGAPVSKQESVTTLTPGNMTMPYLQRIGGYSLKSGSTFGVAIVPVVHFDEHITDKAAAEKALTVTTSPHVDGSWYWADDQDVHWRPQHYYAPGTKVTIAANVYGVKVGKGLYGQSDVSGSFTIGARQITIAEDNAPKSVNKVRVYRNGKLVKTMNTSMGMHSGEQVGGNYIDFHTMTGDYTVLEHDNPAIMSSASYGLPADAPGGYAPEAIYYSTKVSTDGIYLHALDTIYAQDHGIDVSHGCLNLNTPNAKWFYNHSTIGDPVEIQHTGGPTIQVWQGGDWSVPWSKWVKGSALS
jgi:lipoprotein-anchoring transpeptidase ErfK/SrfK